MKKFYKVIKDNFLWEKGAILKDKDSYNGSGGYGPIDEIFKKCEGDNDEYISRRIIEESPEWFKRVYPVNLATKTVYKTKEQAKEFIEKMYK